MRMVDNAYVRQFLHLWSKIMLPTAQMRLAVFGIQNFLIQIVLIVFKSNFDSNTINYNSLLIETIQKWSISNKEFKN